MPTTGQNTAAPEATALDYPQDALEDLEKAGDEARERIDAAARDA